MRRCQSLLGQKSNNSLLRTGYRSAIASESTLSRCTEHLLRCRQSCPQWKRGHVGWRPAGPRPLTISTNSGRWTRDWMSWAGQIRILRKLERVGCCPAGPRTPLAETRIRKLERVSWCPAGPRPPLAATRIRKPDCVDLRPAWPRPPVAATRKSKPGASGVVTLIRLSY